MKWILTSIVTVFLSFYLSGQQPAPGTKGTTPISIGEEGGGAIRAVVIGISDYQDPNIPDLKYSDRDARAFAEFLQSPSGGSLDEDHLMLLLNENATNAQIYSSLDWLIDETQEGDQVIFYFSGHGDVERKTRSQMGFLLPWDSPPQTYVAGSVNLFILQEYLSTLSIENGAKVIVVTDACRSGKLAGSAVGGSQLTTANLAKQFANEVKILSCQPNEYSIEGEQWGGGRGAFSYHLVNGMYGLADRNKDELVTLTEIDRYLEDHVTPEVAPVSQVPFVLGTRTEVLATVDPDMLAKLESKTSAEMMALSQVESRGVEERVLATVDSATQKIYHQFKSALKEQLFFEPADSCADALYAYLTEVPELKPLYNHMKRNYAAALQDEAQQFLNATMVADERRMNFRLFLEPSSYIHFSQSLARAAELLGENHIMYNNLKAKEYYFNGGTIYIQSPFIRLDTARGYASLKWVDKAIAEEPEMACPYFMKSLVYASNLLQKDSAAHYADMAHKLSPSWTLPYQALADLYLLAGEVETAEYYMEKAWAIDTTSVLLHNNRAKVMAAKGEYTEAEELLKEAIEMRPGFAALYRDLGEIYLREFKFDEAREMLLKAIEIDPKEIWAMKLMGYYHMVKAEYEAAEKYFIKARENDIGNVFFLHFDFACYYSTIEAIDKGFEYLEMALQEGFPYYERLEQMPFLSNLRAETDRWNALVDKYFPGKRDSGTKD